MNFSDFMKSRDYALNKADIKRLDEQYEKDKRSLAELKVKLFPVFPVVNGLSLYNMANAIIIRDDRGLGLKVHQVEALHPRQVKDDDYEHVLGQLNQIIHLAKAIISSPLHVRYRGRNV